MTHKILPPLAARATKRSKKELTHCLEWIADRIVNPPSGLSEAERTDALTTALAEVYRYFLPSVKAAATKDPWSWLASACADNDIRRPLYHVWSDGDRLFASDGYRMHSLPVALFPDRPHLREPGPFDPKTGQSTTETLAPPLFRRLFQSQPDYQPVGDLADTTAWTVASDTKCSKQAGGLVMKKADTVDWFDRGYLQAIVKADPDGAEIAFGEKGAPCQIALSRWEGAVAVLMPRRNPPEGF